MKRNPATVHSLAVLSLITNVYIIFLAGTAIYYWQHHGESELRDLFHKIEMERTLGPLVFAFIVDLVCLIVWGIIISKTFVSMCNYRYGKENKPLCEGQCTCEGVSRRGTCHCKTCTPDQPGKCKDHCVGCAKCCYDYIPILSSTVLCPIFCIIAHSPYIAIAYLDDGSHASSMFIYYSILGYAIFGLLWLFFHWCENFESDIAISLTKCRFKCDIIKVNHLYAITLISLFLVTFVLLGLFATITCYFVLIPINKSISDAPNRVVSIYQSGGFIIGSVIVYKILEFFYIKKKKDTVTIEDIHKILQERLPCPVQQPEKSRERPGAVGDEKLVGKEGMLGEPQHPPAGQPGKHQDQSNLRQPIHQSTDTPLSNLTEQSSATTSGERIEADINTASV